MKSFVFFLANFITISDTAAFADHSQSLSLGAPLTFTNVDSFLLFKLEGKIRGANLNDNALLFRELFVIEG